MPIRARLLLTGLLGLLASGAFAPGAADPLFEDPPGLEVAVVPPPSGEVERPPLNVQQGVAPPGSEADSPEPRGAAAATDSWAEAFAESARLQWIPGRQLPEYPVVMNPEVQYFLDRFTGSRRAVVETWMGRAGRYLDMIRETLRGHGLPTDLAFTAMIESGFNPLAVSRAGAKGLWQFMAKTARRYGLRVDQWVDERLDPEKSTVAAAAYLRDLHTQFGSWPLAQAAYNAGEVAVMRAIRATGSWDFWALTRTRLLRRETQEFVPAIQAATIIGRNPEQYGFENGAAGPEEYERVTVPPSTDIRRLAVAAGVSFQMLYSLNPVLVRGVTPPGTSWDLRVPAGTRAGVVAALTPRRPVAIARGARATTRGEVYVVRPRDTVTAIAKRYGVSVGDLLRWNSLEKQDLIRPGDRLRVAELR